MDQLTEFFSGLFATDKWPPRWFCGYWSDFHGWLYIFSDLLIWFAYMCIPVILIRYVRLKKGVPMPRVFWIFGAFIFLCGLTHLIDAIIFWEPIYRFSALVRLITGIVSLSTVVALIHYFEAALGLKTSKEFEFELNYRKQAVKELKRSNKDLADFAHIASHDLQSPLTTIKAYLEYLNKHYAPQLDEKGERMISTTVSSVNRMQTLVDDLLSFSLVGKKSKITAVDLNEVIHHIENDMAVDLAKKEAKIRFKNLPTIQADRSEIHLVMYNLINNGIKYQKEGIKPVIRITAEGRGAYWEIRVQDNGIGIEEKNLQKIFKLFHRLHAKNEYEGTGIGLATVAKIIERYGGSIKAESQFGKGTTFIINLPKLIKLTSQYDPEDQ
jgi:signal transduction histidine kinase